MTENNRGIRNIEHMRQVVDFTGLRFNNATPTDLDLYWEYKGRAHVLGEFKYNGAELPFGQRLALERLAHDTNITTPTIAIIASHSDTGTINAANAIVSDTWWRGTWRPWWNGKTVKELTERFFDYIENNKFDVGE